jgi:mRNA interferase MazF
MAAKVRPCAIVSVAAGDEDRALVTLIPHTTSVRHTQFEAAVPVSFLKAGAFDAQGLVTVPLPYAIRPLGQLANDQMRLIERVLCRWLGLPWTSET